MVGAISPALEIIDAALVEDPGDVAALLMRVKTLRVAGRYEETAVEIERAAPTIMAAENRQAHAELTFERGYVLREMGRFDLALNCFVGAAEVSAPNVDYYCAICDTLCRMNRNEEAVEWRHKILRMRDAEVSCAPQDVITAERPKPFDATRPERNIVSYCLFGGDPYYHECAITNARVTPVMFPEFTARFYCAPDLPTKVLKALKAARAQVLVSGHREGENTSPMAGTFWRFLTFDDPSVDVVLCRDVDSPILPRERAAIDMWLTGSAPLYCLRDHPVHAELILAGLWGGFTGVLPPLGPMASEFIKTDHSRFADQRFLRTLIWPRVRDHAILSIDSIASLDGSVDFPEGCPPNQGRQHVGDSWSRSQILGQGFESGLRSQGIDVKR
jgi:hypothetical protein